MEMIQFKFSIHNLSGTASEIASGTVSGTASSSRTGARLAQAEPASKKYLRLAKSELRAFDSRSITCRYMKAEPK